jgi:N-acetylglucosamine kinase-like BadF-type ATPase
MKTRRVVVGIDGDFARSTAYLFNSESSLISEITAPGYDLFTPELSRITRSIVGIIETLCQNANVVIDALEHIAVVTPGYPADSVETAFRKEFGKVWKRRKSKPGISLKGRTYAAIQSYAFSSPAVAVEYGADVTVCAREMEGKYIYTGGWGHKINYGGGGNYLGKKLIETLVLVYDGRLGGSTIGSSAEKLIGIKSREDLLKKIYQENLSAVDFIPVVLHAVKDKDPFARQIIDSAVDEVVDCIRTVVTRFPIKEMIPLILFGDMTEGDEMFRTLIRRKIRATIPQVTVKNTTVNRPELIAKYAQSFLSGSGQSAQQKLDV